MRIILFFFLACFVLSCSSDPKQNNKTKLFQEIPAKQSNLNFKPEITETFEYNFMLDPYEYNGGGIAVFDANNDGLQDLFFTYRFNGCKLYLNKGDFVFEDVSEKAGVSQASGLKTGVVPVDINADGWMDVYVCRTWLTPLPERQNLLFINNQDGTFTNQAKEYGLNDVSASQAANFFDYDKDGDLDVYIVNHPVDFQNINNLTYKPTPNAPSAASDQPRNEFESDRLLRNDKGKFTDVSKAAGIWNRAWGLSATTSDFNGDGWPDILIANDFIAPDFLYINQKNGTFKEQASQYFRHTANHSMGCDIADLNNDGLPDLYIPDMLGSTLTRRKSLMNSMILERQNQQKTQGYGDQQMRNVLQINNGNGTFSEVGCLAGCEATEWSWSPLIADFDLDGWNDLFLSTGVYRDLNDLDFFFYTADSLQHADGGLSKAKIGAFENFSKNMTSLPMQNAMFRNRGAGKLAMESVGEAWGLTAKGFTNGAAYADLDNDGDLDLIANRTVDVPLLYKNTASDAGTQHWLQIKCKGTATNPMGLGAKIRVTSNGQIYYQEIANVRGFYAASEPIFQVGLGENSRIDRIEVEWVEGKTETIENPKANQRLMLDIKNAKNGQMPPLNKPNLAFSFKKSKSQLNFKHQENTFEDFNHEPLLLRRYGKQGPSLAAADVNGDGLEDVFVGGARGQAGVLLLQNAQQNFIQNKQAAFEADATTEDIAALFFDADQDGDLDLMCISGGNEMPTNDTSYQDRLYLNDGKGNFSKTDFPTEPTSGACVAAYDYDSDGDLDLFVGGRIVPGKWPSAPRSFVFRNDKGKFVDVTKEVAPDFEKLGMVSGLAFGDLDGDKIAEIVVVGEWMPLQIFSFRNGKYEKNTQLTPAQSNGFWNCIELADLDGDGDLDIITGNEGLNTRLEASKTAPLRVYFADFDKNGSLDPIVTQTENGKEFPLAPRNELGAWMPSIIKKKYTRYRAYAQATVQDAFGKNAIESASKLEVHTLASSWWENTSTGFAQHVLPDFAQVSCVKDLEVFDFDKNGTPDLLLVGNDAGNTVETGPYNASNGVLLLNDGKGNFSFIPNHIHGFWANGEARSLASVRAGKSDSYFWFLAKNNAALEVWE